MKLFKFDVMVGDRFVCSMSYPFNPLFPIKEDELSHFIEEKRPSLKTKGYHIAF